MIGQESNRRQFLKTSTAAVGVGLTAPLATHSIAEETPKPRIKIALKHPMIRVDKSMSVLDKFKMVKEIGFDGIELHVRDTLDFKEVVAAVDKTGLPVHGFINSSRDDLKEAIDKSKTLGGTSILVVAGRVDEKNSYDKVYEQQQKKIRAALPHAEKQGIKILVENVWNNFLLSPLEMVRFLDEMPSPNLGCYFDVGNVIRFGWPEQWIRILGKRIGKLDIKDYSRKKQKEEGLWNGFQVKIGEGSCDWSEVRKALKEIGYVDGWATAEVKGGDRDRLKEIAERMNMVLNDK